jgi:hypothetical protein
MIVITKEVPKDFDLLLPGDIHKGTTLMSVSGVDNLMHRLRSKYTYMIFMGDAIDAITGSDRRFDMELSDGTTPVEQADWIYNKFLSHKKKIITWLSGNHESTVKGVGNLVRSVICDKLKVQYGTFSCRVEFTNTNGTRLFSGMFHHGSGQINSTHPDPMVRKAIMTYKLKQKLEPFGGDCALNAMGHTHKLLIYKPVEELYIRTVDGKIVSDYTKPTYGEGFVDSVHRWYVNTGSFQKLYSKGKPGSGYAEVNMYSPVELGYPIVKVRNGQIVDIIKEYV